jgi:hypothetical protein
MSLGSRLINLRNCIILRNRKESLSLNMEKVLKIVQLKDKQSDFVYWQTKSIEEKLNAIEFLRQQYIKFDKNVKPGFQRVCRVINQK